MLSVSGNPDLQTACYKAKQACKAAGCYVPGVEVRVTALAVLVNLAGELLSAFKKRLRRKSVCNVWTPILSHTVELSPCLEFKSPGR